MTGASASARGPYVEMQGVAAPGTGCTARKARTQGIRIYKDISIEIYDNPARYRKINAVEANG